MGFFRRILPVSVLTAPPVATGYEANDVPEFTGSGAPDLVLEDYFNGKTVAYGVFEDRFGKIRRQFKVDITGTVQDGQLTLIEDFNYDDGEQDQRIWVIDILGDGKYRGTAGDVDGYAYGETGGNAFNWKYKVDLSVYGSIWKVGFDDWMYLQADNVLINRAYVTRYGIRIGKVTISFKKA